METINPARCVPKCFWWLFGICFGWLHSSLNGSFGNIPDVRLDGSWFWFEDLVCESGKSGKLYQTMPSICLNGSIRDNFKSWKPEVMKFFLKLQLSPFKIFPSFPPATHQQKYFKCKSIKSSKKMFLACLLNYLEGFQLLHERARWNLLSIRINRWQRYGWFAEVCSR